MKLIMFIFYILAMLSVGGSALPPPAEPLVAPMAPGKSVLEHAREALHNHFGKYLAPGDAPAVIGIEVTPARGAPAGTEFHTYVPPTKMAPLTPLPALATAVHKPYSPVLPATPSVTKRDVDVTNHSPRRVLSKPGATGIPTVEAMVKGTSDPMKEYEDCTTEWGHASAGPITLGGKVISPSLKDYTTAPPSAQAITVTEPDGHVIVASATIVPAPKEKRKDKPSTGTESSHRGKEWTSKPNAPSSFTTELRGLPAVQSGDPGRYYYSAPTTSKAAKSKVATIKAAATAAPNNHAAKPSWTVKQVPATTQLVKIDAQDSKAIDSSIVDAFEATPEFQAAAADQDLTNDEAWKNTPQYKAVYEAARVAAAKKLGYPVENVMIVPEVAPVQAGASKVAAAPAPAPVLTTGAASVVTVTRPDVSVVTVTSTRGVGGLGR